MERNAEHAASLILDPQPIRGRSVVITGGTTGIGRATAHLLARQGAEVLIFARDDKELEDALSSLRETGTTAHGLTADAADAAGIRRVFEAADEHFDRLDVLVNNAALSGSAFQEQDLEEIEQIARTNVAGYIACASEAVRRMRGQGGGHIVNVGSMSADLREEGNSTYVATKAAIQAFSESLRKTVNPDGIKVTLVEPGRVATDLVDMTDREKEGRVERMEMLRPEDVAAAIAFCLMQPMRCDVVSLQLRPHRQHI